MPICFGRFYLVLLNEINKTESDTFDKNGVSVLKLSCISQVFKSVSSNVITGASAFPTMSLLLIGNTVSKHEHPTTESAAVCLKRVAAAKSYMPRSQRRSSGTI